MKKTLLFLSILLLTLTAEAQNNKIYYTSSDGNVVTPNKTNVFGANIVSNTYENGQGVITFSGNVTKIGDEAFGGCSRLTSVTIPESVTTIGNYAFQGCTRLTSVTIPKSVTTIGSYAFYECSSLVSVHISDIAAWCKISFGKPESNPLYYAHNLYLNNVLLTNLEIPNSVASIKKYAFCNCTSINSVTIPKTISKIGVSAFYECSRLKSVKISDLGAWCRISFESTLSNPLYYAHNFYLNNELVTNLEIPESVSSIKDYTFVGCTSISSVTIPNSVTTIGYQAFYYCSGLKSVTIPESVTAIEDYVFSGCSSLTSVTIPNSVTSIGNYAFFKCSSLSSVTISNSVTTIGEAAFYRCSSLTSVTIPNSVTSIGESAFYQCSGLTSLTIGKSVNEIGITAFGDCSSLTSVKISDLAAWCRIGFETADSNPLFYAHNLYLNNVLVTNLEIPNSVTTIGNCAFYSCSSLTSVKIPNSVTSIGSSAFSSCSGLKLVTIGNSVTTIGGSAFRSCSGLKIITIGNSVTTIGEAALYGCKSLTSVTIPNSVLRIGKSAFYQCSGLTSLTIGKSVNEIGITAFGDCSSLKEITSLNTFPPLLGNHVFENVPSTCDLKVPAEAVEYYEDEDGWNYFKIEAFDDSNYKIYYTSTDGKIVEPNDAFGVDIVSNTYENGQGVICFSGSVAGIGEGAFSGCSNMTSVMIPKSVTAIERGAFSDCTNLTEITLLNTTPPTIGEDVFDDVAAACVIKVPAEAVATYTENSLWDGLTIKAIGDDKNKSDANGDGIVNTADVVAIYNIIVNGSGSQDNSEFDVNGDGTINTADVVAIYNYIVKGQ